MFAFALPPSLYAEPIPGQADAAAGAGGAAPAAKVVVPVFRLDGPVTESPAGAEMSLFAPPGTSLKVLLERWTRRRRTRR
jgi:hypothetical protein